MLLSKTNEMFVLLNCCFVIESSVLLNAVSKVLRHQYSKINIILQYKKKGELNICYSCIN